jgi:hypothetical protein
VEALRDAEAESEMERWYSFRSKEFQGSLEKLNSIAIKGSGKTCAFAGKDAALRVFNIKTGEMIQVFENAHEKIERDLGLGITGVVWRPKGGWAGNHPLMDKVSLITFGHPGMTSLVFWVKRWMHKGIAMNKRIALPPTGNQKPITAVAVAREFVYFALGK